MVEVTSKVVPNGFGRTSDPVTEGPSSHPAPCACESRAVFFLGDRDLLVLAGLRLRALE